MKSIDDFNDSEMTIHSLNIHGTFFHRKIASILYSNKHIHNVTLEYPVEYKQKSDGRRGEESRLDILAQFSDRYRENNIKLLIECKKANPDFVDWVFFPKFEGDISVDTRLLWVGAINQEDEPKFVFQHRRIGWNISIADEARETRGEYAGVSKQTKTKTSNASVTEAAYQVVLAAHAIARESYEAMTAANDVNVKPDILIPIIVTTANLFLCQFDPDDTSLEDGQIPKEKVTLLPVSTIIYRYPIPPHAQLEIYEEPRMIQNVNNLIRRDVLVVNSQKFRETLSTVLFRDYSE